MKAPSGGFRSLSPSPDAYASPSPLKGEGKKEAVCGERERRKNGGVQPTCKKSNFSPQRTTHSPKTRNPHLTPSKNTQKAAGFPTAFLYQPLWSIRPVVAPPPEFPPRRLPPCRPPPLHAKPKFLCRSERQRVSGCAKRYRYRPESDDRR